LLVQTTTYTHNTAHTAKTPPNNYQSCCSLGGCMRPSPRKVGPRSSEASPTLFSFVDDACRHRPGQGRQHKKFLVAAAPRSDSNKESRRNPRTLLAAQPPLRAFLTECPFRVSDKRATLQRSAGTNGRSLEPPRVPTHHDRGLLT
jgi:hypothetical protein